MASRRRVLAVRRHLLRGLVLLAAVLPLGLAAATVATAAATRPATAT